MFVVNDIYVLIVHSYIKYTISYYCKSYTIVFQIVCIRLSNIIYFLSDAAQKCPLFSGPSTKAEFKNELQEVLRSSKQRFRNKSKKALREVPAESNKEEEEMMQEIQQLRELEDLHGRSESDYQNEASEEDP